MNTTEVCLLTPTGRSAVAVVAVHGCDGLAIVDRYFLTANGLNLADQSIGRIIYGNWSVATGEDVVVCRRTAEELEIHCHGGYQSAPRIIADLCREGCTEVDWQTWLSRPTSCQLTHEAQVAITDAPTLRTAKILLDQFHGALRRELAAIVSDLENNELSVAAERLEQLLMYRELGLHLTQPWRVVIAGRPNVGKSCLINALSGIQRAIVYDQPGTTRDVISVATAVDGWPIELSDTAGLRTSADTIEKAGICLAKEQLHLADLVLWVLDATDLEETNPNALANKQATSIGVKLADMRNIIVLNKVDLLNGTSDFGSQVVATCATSGFGIEPLLVALASQLVPQLPPAGAAIPFTEHQVANLHAAQQACHEVDTQQAVDALQSCFVSCAHS